MIDSGADEAFPNMPWLKISFCSVGIPSRGGKEAAMKLIRSDLDFILAQIIRAETNAPLQSPDLPFGLRTVDGTNNNAVPGQSEFGSADRIFPRMTDPVFRDAEDFDFGWRRTGARDTYFLPADERCGGGLAAAHHQQPDRGYEHVHESCGGCD